MPLNARGFVQHPPARPAQAQHRIGNHHAGGQGGRARSQALAEGNPVVDLQIDGRHGALQVAGNANRRLPDQVVFAIGYKRRVAAGHKDTQLIRRAEAALQINSQSQAQRVEGGT